MSIILWVHDSFCACHASCVVWLDGHLVLGGESGDIHVWKADTLQEIARHKAHSGWCISKPWKVYILNMFDLCFSPSLSCRHCNMPSPVYRRLCASVRQQGQVCRCMASYIKHTHTQTVLSRRITVTLLFSNQEWQYILCCSIIYSHIYTIMVASIL
jgi:hypothetical protein